MAFFHQPIFQLISFAPNWKVVRIIVMIFLINQFSVSFQNGHFSFSLLLGLLLPKLAQTSREEKQQSYPNRVYPFWLSSASLTFKQPYPFFISFPGKCCLRPGLRCWTGKSTRLFLKVSPSFKGRGTTARSKQGVCLPG